MCKPDFKPKTVINQAEIIEPEQWQGRSKVKRDSSFYPIPGKIIPFSIPKTEKKEMALTYTEMYDALHDTISMLDILYTEDGGSLPCLPSFVFSHVMKVRTNRKNGVAI